MEEHFDRETGIYNGTYDDPSREDGWEEDLEDWEDDRPYDVSDMMAEAIEAAKRAAGIDRREDYDSPYEHIVDHVGYHGIVGVVRGAVVTLAAIAAEIARVVIKTLTGQREQFRFGEAVRQAQDAQQLRSEQKRQNREERKDRAERQEAPERAGTQKERMYQAGQEQTTQAAEIVRKSDQEIADVLKDPGKTDSLVSACLGHPDLEQAFRDLGVVPVQEEESDRVFLFSTRVPMDKEHLTCISKEECLTGNANALAAALCHYTEKTPESRMESVVQAAVTTAKMRSIVQPELLEAIQKGGEGTVILSSAVFDTPDHARAFLAVTANGHTDRADLYYNDHRIGEIPLTGAVPEDVLTRVLDTYKEDRAREYTIQDLSFAKVGPDQIRVTAGGEQQTFPVAEERHLKPLSEFLEAHGHPEDARAMALVMGAVANPELKESRDTDGFAINPFTGEKKVPGDFRVEITGPETQLMRLGLSAGNGGIRERREPVCSLRGYGSRMDLDRALDAVKTAMERPGRGLEFADYQQPVPEREPYVSLFDRPMTGDGTAAFERLKTQAVLDGMDVSGFRFVERPSREERQEPETREAEPTREPEREAVPEAPKGDLGLWEEEPLYQGEEDIDYDALMRVGYTADGRNIDLSTGQEIFLEEEEPER